MSICFRRLVPRVIASALLAIAACGEILGQSQPSSSSQKAKHSAASPATLDSGSVTNGIYRNRTLALSCKIPAGWVLRTEEMNERDEDPGAQENPQPPFVPQGEHGTQRDTADDKEDRGARVLLAAFSRPPEAHGDDVNSSILIAAEGAAAYPGLKDAAQYFGPLTEVAKARGFNVDEEPYEVEIGKKTLVRGDFHKDVGTRVMLQSTLAMLAHGYAVSITVIGGTEDEVEELIDGLEFAGSARTAQKPK